MKKACLCGSGKSYASCCQSFHQGKIKPPTAESLMRSRYAAFALGLSDYLSKTWCPITRPGDLQLEPEMQWIKLSVLNSEKGSLIDQDGLVEFKAYYSYQGQDGYLHEISRFQRNDKGDWCYLDGKILN